MSIHLHGPKWSNYKIAKYLKVSQPTIQNWLQTFQETGDVQDRARTGRPSVCDEKTDKIILQEVSKKEDVSTKAICETLKKKGKVMSPTTVRRSLSALDFVHGALMQKPLLSDIHKKKRLKWAKAMKNKDWKRVLFSDETTIQLFQNKKQVWYRRGHRPIHRVVKHPMKVHIWSCISHNGKGFLNIFTENLDANKMCEIYENTLQPSLQKLFGTDQEGVTLQEDNDPKHTSKKAREWKGSNNIEVLPWPACSPDLNPIENLWKLLKFNVAAKKPQNLLALKRTIKKEWENLSSDLGERLVSSMSRRIQQVIKAEGDFILY